MDHSLRVHLNDDVLVLKNEATEALVFFFEHGKCIDVRRSNGSAASTTRLASTSSGATRQRPERQYILPHARIVARVFL
ncbi:MAG: hypothetical protein ACI8PT_003221, partial [Gammaproteobacteria bacterium]